MKSSTCDVCGAAIPPDAPEGLCPRCLLAPAPGSEPPAPPATPGTRIRYVGDYELLVELGRGGMGVVYRARQQTLGREVALKMILAGSFASRDEVRRFQREAEAAAQLDHPAIAPIYEVGEHEGLPYFSMKLLPGGHLRCSSFRGRPREAAALCAAVARAVHHAHERGLLHLDIKPGNVLLDDAGAPHVADFGIARRIGSAGTTSVVGTPEYMAPEQASQGGKGATVRSDVYSLGAILYELLVGQPPYSGEGTVDVLMKVATGDLVPPRRRAPSVDVDLETICLTAMARDPSRRYASALDLARDLERWAAGLPVSARPVGLAERAVKAIRRRPAVAATAAVSALALLFVTIVLGSAALAERRLATQLLYETRVALAQREVQANAPRRAAELLALCPERLRGWEWGHLDRFISQGSLAVELAGQRRADCVAFAPDGASAAIGADDLVLLVDTATGAVVTTLAGHEGFVRGLSFSPDGRQLASVGWARDDAGEPGGTLRVWDLTNGAEVVMRRLAGRPSAVAFSPDGARIATVSQQLIVWDARQGDPEAIMSGPSSDLVVEWSTDGSRLAAAGNARGLRIWDAASGAIVDQCERLPGEPRDLVWEGGRLVALLSLGESLWAWDPASGRERARQQMEDVVRDAVFLRGGSEVAFAAEDGVLRLVDVATGRSLSSFEGHENDVRAVAASADGTHLAIGGPFRATLWTQSPAPEPTTLRSEGRIVNVVALSADGVLLAGAGDGEVVTVWDLASGSTVATFRQGGGIEHITALAFSPDRRLLAASALPGPTTVWDLGTGKEHATLQSRISFAQGLAFGPRGERLLAGGHVPSGSGGYTGGGVLWDVASGRILRNHSGWAPAVAIAPDGSFLFTGGEILRSGGLTTLAKLSLPKAAESASVSPDGRRIATVDDRGNVTLWDSSSGRQILALDRSGARTRELRIHGGLKGGGSLLDTFRSAYVWFLQDGRLVAARGDMGDGMTLRMDEYR